MVSSPQQSVGAKNNRAVEVGTPIHIGAEIRGVDLTRPLPPKQLQEVRDAFLKWKVRPGQVFPRETDSALEQSGFEPLVPLPSRILRRTVQAGINA
jgi:hypothetical protein